MPKDGPKAGGIRFGYREHLKSGVPWLSCSSNAQINLQNFVRKHAGRTDLVQEVRARLDRGDSPSTILNGLREDGYEGNFAAAHWLNRNFSGASTERYCENRAELERWITDLQRLGVCKSWQFWERNEETGDWFERDCFPPEVE